MAHFLPNQAKLDDFRTIQGPAKPVRTRDEQGFMVMDSVIVCISHALRNSYKIQKHLIWTIVLLSIVFELQNFRIASAQD